MQKITRKNTKYSRNENRPSCKGYIGKAKAIVLEKWLIWVKNWKGQKHEKNDSTITLGLFFAENRSKKHQIFEKWDKFENRPCCKGYIVFAKWSILVKNWKRQKHAKNHSTITLQLFCAKNQSKKHQIFEKWDNLKKWRCSEHAHGSYFGVFNSTARVQPLYMVREKRRVQELHGLEWHVTRILAYSKSCLTGLFCRLSDAKYSNSTIM